MKEIIPKGGYILIKGVVEVSTLVLVNSGAGAALNYKLTVVKLSKELEKEGEILIGDVPILMTEDVHDPKTGKIVGQTSEQFLTKVIYPDNDNTFRKVYDSYNDAEIKKGIIEANKQTDKSTRINIVEYWLCPHTAIQGMYRGEDNIKENVTTTNEV
jgi:hypothetical protein